MDPNRGINPPCHPCAQIASGSAMISVAITQSSKDFGIVTHNDRIHALGDCDLPSAVFSEALNGATLA